MKDISNFFIKMVESNPVPGPHKFGPFTDTILAMTKRAGHKYEAYFKISNDKLVPIRPIPNNINYFSIVIAPYLADEIGKSPFAKAEAEYMIEKVKNKLDKSQYEHCSKMLNDFDEFTDTERQEYDYYKVLFSKI